MPTLQFWVEGAPQPQGSKTAGLASDGRAFVRDKNPRALKEWRSAVTQGVRSQLPDWWEEGPIDMAILVRLRFWMPRPKSAPKTIDIPHTTRPDADKLLRAVMDSLTMSKFIKDDSIANNMIVNKRYAIDPA